MNFPSSSPDLPAMSQLFKPPTPRQLSSEHHLSSQHSITFIHSESTRQSLQTEQSHNIEQSNHIQQSNQRRSFRTRKQCQIKPYTTETHKYLKALQSTDWQDAVVIMPRRPHKIRDDENADELNDNTLDSFISDSSTPEIPSSQIGQFCERSYKRRRRASSEGPRRPNQPRFRDEIIDSQTTDPSKGTSRRKSPQCHIPVSKWLTDPSEPDDHSYTRRLDSTLSASTSNVLHRTPQTLTPDARISSPATSCPSHVSPTPSPTSLRRTFSFSPERAHHHFSLRPPQSRQPRLPTTSSTTHSKHTSTDAVVIGGRRVSVPHANLKSLINPKIGNSTRSVQNKASRHRASVLDLTLDSSPISNQRNLNNGTHTTANRSGQDPQPSKSYRTSVRKTTGKTPQKPAEKRKEYVEKEKEDEEDEDQEEEETDDESLLREAVLPKKARLKLLGRMMPKSYVKKAAKDLKLMEQERKHGRLKLTLSGSDSNGSSGSESERPMRTAKKTTTRPVRRPSISPPRNFCLDSPEPERPGITWAEKLVSRVPSAQNANADSSHEIRLNRYHPRRSPSLELRDANPPAKKSRAHHPTEETDLVISLKDDHAFWRTHESANAIPSLNLAPPSIRAQQSGPQPINPRLPITSLINAFKDFTPDFSIPSLNPDIKIQSETNYLSGGYLSNLINIIQGIIPGQRVDLETEESKEFFGQSYSMTMSPITFVERLVEAADLVQDELNLHLALDSARTTDALSQMSRGFRFFGEFVSHQRPTTISMMSDEELAEEVRKWTDEMIDRLDDLALDSVNRPEFSKLMLVVSWGLFELGCRLHARVEGSEIVERATKHLIRRLLEYGPPHTMSSLKEAIKDPIKPITDLSIEIWVSLINIVVLNAASPKRAACLTKIQFWNTVTEQTRQFSEKSGLIGSVAQGEAQGYVAMSLCAFSQFLPNGVSGKEPRMEAHWSAIQDLLENLNEDCFAEGLSRIASDRRDCYVRSIFGRALLFHQRWKWKLVFQDGMLQKLYRVFHQAKFQQLRYEINHPRRFGGPDAFPEVLEDLSSFQLTQWGPPEGLGGQPLRDSDTCFGIFLKLILASAHSLEWPLDAIRRSEIERIVSTCTPVRRINFAPLKQNLGLKNELISDQDRSALIQICSLSLIYIAILPKQSRRQIQKIENFYDFGQVDEPTRLFHFKIWKKSMEILSWCEFKVNVLVEKFSIPMKVLSKEFNELELEKKTVKVRLNGFNKLNLNHRDKEVEEKKLKEINEGIQQKIRLIERCLESVEGVMKVWREIEIKQFIGFESQWVYPDLSWLDSAWSIELTQNEIFREGSIGRLANRIIRTFLDQRDLAIENLEMMKMRLKEDEDRIRLEDEEDDEDDEGIELRKDIASLEKRENGLIAVIDDRLVRPICGYLVLMNNLKESSEEKKKKEMFELIESWARLDQIKRRNGIEVENWMNQLKIKDQKNGTNFVGIKDEMIKIMIGMQYMTLTIKIEKEKINQHHQLKEDSISLWFSSLVIHELHLQEEFTKEIIKVEKEILPWEKIKEIIDDEEEEDEFEVKRIQIIQEVIKKFIKEGISIENRKYIGIMSETICKSYGELSRKKTLDKDLIDRYLNGIIKSFIKSITEDPQSWIDWNSVPKLRMLKKFY